MRSIIVAALLTTVAASSGRSATPDDVWQIQVEQEPKGKRLICRSEQLAVDFTEQQAWTIGHIVYDGKELVGQYGANGSVVNAQPRPEDEVQDPWIGTGHGREKITRLALLIDGKSQPIEAGARAAGDSVVLRKQSNLGPLDHEAEISLSPDGTYLTERHAYRVIEPLEERFHFVYAYMHCNRNALDRWVAILPDDSHLEGRAGQQDRKFQLGRDIRAIAFFSPADEVGVAYVYPQVYAGAKSFRHSIWDRPADNKLYFRPDVSADKYQVGDRFEFVLQVVPFATKGDDWLGQAEEAFEAASARLQ